MAAAAIVSTPPPAMRRPSASSVADNLTFSEIVNPETKQVGGCSLCHLFEGLITEIFPTPSSSSSSSPFGTIVTVAHDELTTMTPVSSPSSSINDNKKTSDKENLRPPPSPRSVCRAWKIKRREQRRRALLESSSSNSSPAGMSLAAPKEQLAGKESNGSWNERDMQCNLKKNAYHIQRNFEQAADATAEDDYQSYRYEQYGNRAVFIQDQQGRRKKRGGPLEERDDAIWV